MRMCQEHWDMLREEVNKQGMSVLISGNGEIATMRMVAELQGGEDTKDNFDPLMRCFWMIMNESLTMIGLHALVEDFGCPICFLNSKRNPDGSCPCADPDCMGKAPGTIPNFETWITGDDSCVMSVRDMCIERGWIDG